jgi:predicted glycosyltransferase
MMKLIVELRHPAHYHHFKYAVTLLREHGHEVKILAVDKDILLRLLEENDEAYVCIGKNRPGLWNKVIEIWRQTIRIKRIFCTFHPDIAISRASIPIAMTCLFSKTKSIVFMEDDFNTVWMNALLPLMITNAVVTPAVVRMGPFKKKRVSYNGYQKTAYLHPRYFTPDIKKANTVIRPSEKNFIIRLSAMKASHDIYRTGITDALATALTEILREKGNVMISAERDIPEHLKNYIFHIPVSNIHHIMYFADLLITDSMSMSMEAALLGLPNIRVNNFRKVSTLDELEKNYQLTKRIEPSDRNMIIDTVKSYITNDILHEAYQRNRERLYKEKIDVTAFMVEFIKNFPGRKKQHFKEGH